MNVSQIRQKYIEFFVDRKHHEIPSASLVPENDPTTLFTSSGMQPLIPYLMGQKHPHGTRLVDSQKCFRSVDIEEVGDNRHMTFFEMLGNWSLGDYFKDEQLPWLWEFLTKKLHLPKERLWVTIFSGGSGVEKDKESFAIWKKLGIPESRIHSYPADKNWWSRSGPPDNMPVGEIGGPDSEVFYEFTSVKHNPKFGRTCHPNCDCGRFLEIGNSVFIQYKKTKIGDLEELPQKNVDFGGGLERLAAVVNDDPDVFNTDFFVPLIQKIEEISGKKYTDKNSQHSFRVIADHVKAAVMLASDGVFPSNKEQGYFSRRLIRRSVRYAKLIGIEDLFIADLVPIVADLYKNSYPDVAKQSSVISSRFSEEEKKFKKTLEKGLKEFEKFLTHKFGEGGKPKSKKPFVSPSDAFRFYETYGFPVELFIEIAREKDISLGTNNSEEDFLFNFEEEKKNHADTSRAAAIGKFKGGLADHSEQTTKLHTAHHLLLAALQKVVDSLIKQRGSNITAQRLRIDISFSRKITEEELQKVEDIINGQIAKNLPVARHVMKKEDAQNIGAQMEFGQKYPDQVSVYFVGLRPGVIPEKATSTDYLSAEFCGGPHVANTADIGKIKIFKEQSAGAGIRRLYAKLC